MSVVNWTDEAKNVSVVLDDQVTETLLGERYLVSEFFSQKILGIFENGSTVDLGACAPHTSQILRITPWDGMTPTLAGTDLHFSGGGVEVADWQVLKNGVEGQIETRWWYPVKVSVAFPQDDGFDVKVAEVSSENRFFQVME